MNIIKIKKKIPRKNFQEKIKKANDQHDSKAEMRYSHDVMLFVF